MTDESAQPKRRLTGRHIVVLVLLGIVLLITIPVSQFALDTKKRYDNEYTRVDVLRMLPLALGMEEAEDGGASGDDGASGSDASANGGASERGASGDDGASGSGASASNGTSSKEFASSRRRMRQNQGTLIKAESRLLSGMFELDRHRYERAAELLTEAADNLLVYPGKKSHLTYLAYIDLGRALEKTNRSLEAKDAYKSALECAELYFGKEHQNVAEAKRSIAYILSKQNKREEARELYRQAYELDLKGLGADDLDVAYDAACIGEMEFRLKNYLSAIDWYQKSLPIYQKVRGAGHPSYAWVAENLGRAYYESADFEESARHFETVAKAVESSLGASHKDHCRLLAWHAWAATYAGDKPAAFESARRLKVLLGKKSDKELSDLAQTVESNADIFVLLNDHAEAEDLYLKLLRTQEATIGKESPALCRVLASLCECSERAGRIDAARQYLARAEKLCGNVVGDPYIEKMRGIVGK